MDRAVSVSPIQAARNERLIGKPYSNDLTCMSLRPPDSIAITTFSNDARCVFFRAPSKWFHGNARRLAPCHREIEFMRHMRLRNGPRPMTNLPRPSIHAALQASLAAKAKPQSDQRRSTSALFFLGACLIWSTNRLKIFVIAYDFPTAQRFGIGSCRQFAGCSLRLVDIR